MRVLHVINDLSGGGAEKLVVDLVHAHNQLGAQADVLVLCERGAVYSTSDLPEAARLLVSRESISIYNPLHVLRLRIATRGYDVVHVHLFPSQYWMALAHVLGGRVPVVTTEHSTSHGRMRWPVLRPLDRWMLRRFAKIVAISTETRLAVSNWLRLPESRLEIIGNGIDLRHFRESRPFEQRSELDAGLRPDDVLLAMVGRLQHPKDHVTVFRALSLLPANHKLILVGEGPRREEYQEYCRTHGLLSRVVFAGFRRDVSRILKTCDVSILSSEWEGVPLAAIEGMAAGTPFLGADVVGIASLVGGAGVLFAGGDADDLAMKVTHTLALTASERQALVARQYERSRAYDLTATAGRYMALYEEVCRSRGRR